MAILSKSAEILLQYDNLWAAAGTPYAVFSLPSQELQAATNGIVISIKESL